MSAFCVPVFYGDDLIGFSVTTAHHLDIGAHTPGSCGIVDAVDAYAEGLQFKAIKVGRPGQAQRRGLAHGARQHPHRRSRRRRHEGADRGRADRRAALSSIWCAATAAHTVGAAGEDLMDYSERMMRKAISDIPDGVYAAETFIDGYPRRSRPGATRSEDRRHHHGAAATNSRRSDRHVAAGRRPADQHAVRGHRRLRDLADAALDPARQRGLRQHPAERRHHPADQDRRAEGHARQSDFSGAGDRAFSPGNSARRHGDEGARAGGAAIRSVPASAICA